MAKKKAMAACGAPWFGWLVLLVFLLLLLEDFNVFALGLNWYTYLFLLWGVKLLWA
ncbi:hypothetical protein KY330_05525 [Candidatus Woesearchaeota archaeon]|nr:hypothetical protein [Candidatus Woesearchaeota archaeon]